MVKQVLLVDDNITNSDWVKANAFDFPGVETVKDFERALDVPVSEPARTMRLQALAQLPWAKVTPEPIYELLFPSATTNKSLIDLIKASFGGDRSAAGRYAAEQRWKGNRKKEKPKGKKRVSAVERTKEQKMSDGPILVNGRDKFGFPKLLSVADAEKKFGKTPEEIKEYFKKRGLTINLEPETKILVQPPELYAALQGVDDVLNAIKTESKEGFTVVAGTNQPLPEVTIQYITPSSEGAVGGDFTQMGENSWKVPNINLYAGMMTVYGKIIGESPGSTIPQLSASNREQLSKTGEFSQAVTYGFAVHEFGHFVDYAMRRGGVMSFWSTDMKNALRMREAVGENSRMRTEILEGLSDDFKTKGKLFSEVGGRALAGLENEPGMKYSSTNTLEKFAETFTSWFLLSQAKSVWVDRAKANLKARGSDFVIEKITDVVKQATIKDNLMEFPPDHPIFLFAFGRMQDTDATVSKSLIDLLKASFGGDRSAAGRYAANMRWQRQGGGKGSKAKDIREELKTYFGTSPLEYFKSEGHSAIRRKRIEKESYNTGIGDLQLEIIADKQGFSGKPKVVSSEEMAQLEKDGWTIAYRGIEDLVDEREQPLPAEELIEQFKTGNYFAGNGTSGNGIYFARDEIVANTYAGNTTKKTIGGISYEVESDIKRGAVMKVAIPPNVLMSETDFKDALAKHRDSMKGYAYEGEWYGDDDIGRNLAAKGVRGVEISLSLGIGNTATGSKAVIIYDRSMLAVEESKKTK